VEFRGFAGFCGVISTLFSYCKTPRYPAGGTAQWPLFKGVWGDSTPLDSAGIRPRAREHPARRFVFAGGAAGLCAAGLRRMRTVRGLVAAFLLYARSGSWYLILSIYKQTGQPI